MSSRTPACGSGNTKCHVSASGVCAETQRRKHTVFAQDNVAVGVHKEIHALLPPHFASDSHLVTYVVTSALQTLTRLLSRVRPTRFGERCVAMKQSFSPASTARHDIQTGRQLYYTMLHEVKGK